MAFVGRDRDLSLLNARLVEIRATGRGALIAMRGRRRVGKSRLAEEFVSRSGCPFIYYTAVTESGGQELERLIAEMAQSPTGAGETIRSGMRPESWEAALSMAAQGATRDAPVIVVIDELPYLAHREPSIEGVLQKVWDRTLQHQPVMVLLIGSDEAMMEALNAHGRPLFDRAREMVVHPLSPSDIAVMLRLDAAAALDAYLVIGGFPVLAMEWGHGRTLWDYLAQALGDPTSYLVVSAERALAAEFPQEARARLVLGTIGANPRAHSYIAQHTALAASSLNGALGDLLAKRVIERHTPYSAKAAPRNAQWTVRDPYLRFWLRFVYRGIDLIERGRGGMLLDEVRRSWAEYRGRAIEPLVREAVERMLPDPERFGNARFVGSYWTRTGAHEVDIVVGDNRPVASVVGAIGSIKWRERSAFTRRDAGLLATHRSAVPGAAPATRLVGVSRSGFHDDGLLDVRLGPEELLASWHA